MLKGLYTVELLVAKSCNELLSAISSTVRPPVAKHHVCRYLPIATPFVATVGVHRYNDLAIDYSLLYRPFSNSKAVVVLRLWCSAPLHVKITIKQLLFSSFVNVKISTIGVGAFGLPSNF